MVNLATKEKKTLKCLSCGDSFGSTEYYTTNSNNFKHSEVDGKNVIPFCKACVQKKHQDLLTKLQNKEMATYMLCGILDIPFKFSAMEMAEKQKSDNVGVYIRVINSRKEFKSLDFSDSDSFNSSLATEIEEYKTRWGDSDNLSIQDYKNLDYRFNQYVKDAGLQLEKMDFTTIDQYRKLALASVMYDRDIQSSESKDRNAATANYTRIIQSFKTMNKDEKLDKDKSLCELINEFEFHSPIINDERHKDIDKMNEVKKYIVDHMKKIFTR